MARKKWVENKNKTIHQFCEYCKNEFVYHRIKKFCSPECCRDNREFNSPAALAKRENRRRANKLKQDKYLLYKGYVEQGLTLKKIGKIECVTHQCVQQYIKNNGLSDLLKKTKEEKKNICKLCGKRCKTKKAIFCSKNCRFWHNKMKMKCAICGKGFLMYIHAYKHRTDPEHGYNPNRKDFYCSKECFYKRRSKK